MAQSYPVMECIIVDDASPDDSIVKCERLIAGYDGPIKFIILHHDHNRGLSAARNSGTDAAQGDYVFYLDSDDELTPDCIEKLAEPIERDASIEMVVGNYLRFSNKTSVGKITREEEFISSAAVREFFFDRRILSVMAWNKLILKKFLQEYGLYFMEGILYEDNPWTFYLVKHLQHLYVIPDITYYHYKRPLSITTGTDKKLKTYYFSIIYGDIARHFTPGEETREAKYYIGSFFSNVLTNPLMEGFKLALPLFENALTGEDCRRERLCLWALRLSTKSSLLNRTFAGLLMIRYVILTQIRLLGHS